MAEWPDLDAAEVHVIEAEKRVDAMDEDDGTADMPTLVYEAQHHLRAALAYIADLEAKLREAKEQTYCQICGSILSASEADDSQLGPPTMGDNENEARRERAYGRRPTNLAGKIRAGYPLDPVEQYALDIEASLREAKEQT